MRGLGADARSGDAESLGTLSTSRVHPFGSTTHATQALALSAQETDAAKALEPPDKPILAPMVDLTLHLIWLSPVMRLRHQTDCSSRSRHNGHRAGERTCSELITALQPCHGGGRLPECRME